MDVFVVGAQKAGTTSIHGYLSQHPDIHMLPDKDAQSFFDLIGDRTGARDRTLERLYGRANEATLRAAAHANLLYFERAPGDLLALNPGGRIIAILRNPVDRAYSAFWYARRNGLEPCERFEDAIAREPERRDGTLAARAGLTYLHHGLYAEQLERYLALFGRDQLFVGLFDELLADTTAFVKGLLAWLGLPADEGPLDVSTAHNRAAMPRWHGLQRVIMAPDSRLKRGYRRAAPHSLQRWIGRRVISPIRRSNLRPFAYPPMNAGTRDSLAAYFAPHNERLGALIGRDVSHWR